MDRITVSLASRDGSTTPGVFQFDRRARDCRLLLTWEGRELHAEGSDFFTCLCDIRRHLELLGLRPRCYGASRCAYPSRMCRDMGRGLKVYKNQPGRRASRDDLVGTFADGTDVEPVTVEEQWQFHLDWLASLGWHLVFNTDGTLEEYIERVSNRGQSIVQRPATPTR